MGDRFTKFKSNYLMRSRHQRTDLGTILERDWVTTNGLNVLRFGPGRKIWYNSGNFVFTTANIPTYHKKHKLATEIKTWTWDDCKSADGTVNDVTPNFYTTDLRDYAYYGSCVEMIRSTVEDIISDFPGSLMTTFNYPKTDWRKTGHIVEYIESEPEFDPVVGNISLQVTPSNDYPENCWNINKKWFYCVGPDSDPKWEEVTEVPNISSMTELDTYYYVLEDGTVKKKFKETNEDGLDEIKIDNYGTPIVTNNFISYYTKDFKYYEYNYETKDFDEKTTIPIGVVDGFVLDNPFKIDMHHKRVILDKYDNPMRFMAQSWSKYCVVNGEGKEEKITSFAIEPKDVTKCCEEGMVMYDIKIWTEKTEKSNPYVIKAYYVGGDIVYIYNNNKDKNNLPITEIRPQQEYIDDYFANLKGFKRQLLRQDTIPLYSNKFITPVEENLIWFYPVEMHIWPSKGYCIDISSEAFETFIGNLFELGQNFDELWCDNLYRSMTHESIKNFDWTYSRDYYEGDAQDNIEGGERMQKIIRVFGRAFDDIKLYIDTIKNIKNTTYDKYKNAPEALLSDEVSIKGIDVKSTISADYDLDAKITAESLDTNVIEKDKCWVDKSLSTLPKWYPTRRSEDVFCDVCDNEMMRRMLLSVKRIMQTKGTQQSIEMIFGLFGFGRGIDYEIEEEAFFTEQMIPSEECVDGTRGWTEEKGVDLKQVNSRKKGDLAVEINADKDLDLLYYEDSLSGVPMREVLLGRENTPYLVPYYDSTQLYDGDLIFQGKGGWGKFIKRDDDNPLDDCFNYQETVSYLHVVGTVGELLSINPYTVDNNVIYYVANLEDYTTYDDDPPMDINNHITMSHYFILINNFETHKLSSWKNIVVSTELDVEGKLQIVEEKYKEAFKKLFTTDGKQDWAYSPAELPSDATDEEKLGTYKYAFAKMSYLDSILSTNIANNPHVGYGNYDDGNTFIEYMKLPFKYLIDNKNIQNSILDTLAECYKFDDITDNKINEKDGINKIHIMNSRQPNDKGLTDFIKYTVEKDKLTEKHTLGDDGHNLEKRWFINSKVLTIKSLKSYKVKSPIMEGEEVKYPQGKVLNETEWSELSKEDQDKCEEIKPHPSYKVILPIMDGKKVKYPQGRFLVKEEWDKLSKDDRNKCVEHYLFDEYFKTIIMPYVMQVIPSTTILKLKNFSV